MGGYFVTIGSRSIIASIACAICALALFDAQILAASELEFVGNTSFTATGLSQALETIPEYYLRAHVNRDQGKQIELVEQLLRNGYQKAGFPDTKIKVNAVNNQAPADNQLRVEIEEGQQFRNGHVRISGVDDVMASRIVERLSTPYPSGEAFPIYVDVDGADRCLWKSLGGTEALLDSPIWEQGKLTDFCTDTEDVITEVADAISDLGYSSAKLQTSIVKVADSHVVELHVDISEMGLAKQAEQIRVVGVRDDEFNDVLSYLKLNTGDRVDTSRIQEIYRALWESGRFASFSIEWDDLQQNMLTIQLEKVSGVPWISQPLDEKGQVILRCQKWLAGVFSRGEEISIESKEYSAQTILSSKGYFADVAIPYKQKDDEESADRLQVVYNSEGTLLNRSSHSEWLTIPRDYLEVQANLSLGIEAAAAFALPDDSKSESSVFYGYYNFQFQSAGGRYRYYDRMGLKANPATLLPLAYRKDVDSRFIDSNLEISSNQLYILIESSTGRVLSFKSNNVEVHIGTGMFDAAMASMPSKPNIFAAEKPISSVLKFARDIKLWEVYTLPNHGEPAELYNNSHLYSAFAKIAELREFGPVEDILKEYLNHGRPSSGFNIPTEKLSGFWRNIAIRSLRASELFERESWPAKVALLNAMLIMENGDEVNSILDEVQKNPQSGPTCYAMITRVLWMHGHPRAKAFAKAARTARESDRSETEWLVVTSLLPQDSSDNIFNTIRNLSSHERQSIKRAIYGRDFAAKVLRMILDDDPSEHATLSHVLHESAAAVNYSFLLELKKSGDEIPVEKKQEHKLKDLWDLRSASSDIKVTK